MFIKIYPKKRRCCLRNVYLATTTFDHTILQSTKLKLNRPRTIGVTNSIKTDNIFSSKNTPTVQNSTTRLETLDRLENPNTLTKKNSSSRYDVAGSIKLHLNQWMDSNRHMRCAYVNKNFYTHSDRYWYVHIIIKRVNESALPIQQLSQHTHTRNTYIHTFSM